MPRYWLYRVDGEQRLLWQRHMGPVIIAQLLKARILEKSRCLHRGLPANFYADAEADARSLPLNRDITRFYREFFLTQAPGIDPNILSTVHGDVIVEEWSL